MNDAQLEQVSGGVINVFLDVPGKQEYWKYTCRACGNVGIVLGRPTACCDCGNANITCEEYKPVVPE